MSQSSGPTDLQRIVKLVMDRGLNPVIIFSFSKKECEKYALDLNKEDYNDEAEKDLITQVRSGEEVSHVTSLQLICCS